jgi:hypothetical protein
MYRQIRTEVPTTKSNETSLLQCDDTSAHRQSQMSQRNLLPQSVELRTEAASSLKMVVTMDRNTQTLCHR